MANAQDPVSRLRHDLANPLAALMIETQLLLQQTDHLDPDTVTALREIEKQARRIRDVLQASAK